ncbi:MAG: hypothetical protein HC769_07070 [Cyanobacteria bacterium CRU_2_1]|nr:hypothetical protein [Cyanobacteria bacterium RU_5_0]NJR58635.1 hypothetical protein [Cyanobacteria bacterium CRU_2_1]
MGRDSKRFWFVITVCAALGVVFGATTSQAAIDQCLSDDTPSHECLTQDPLAKRVEGIGMGLMVGVGAAVGAVWQVDRKS